MTTQDKRRPCKFSFVAIFSKNLFRARIYRPFRFARHGSSKFAREGSFGRGSSQVGSDPPTLVHTKHPMEDTRPASHLSEKFILGHFYYRGQLKEQ